MNFHVNGSIAPLTMGLWALYEYRIQVWRKPVAWAFAIVVILFSVPYLLWVNQDPLRFDIDRRASEHLTFSAGPHLCVGQILAPAEIR